MLRSFKMTMLEWIFAVLTLALAAGYLFGGARFVHLGLPLPLPAALGRVPGTEPRLYVSELYLLSLLGLAALHARESVARLTKAIRKRNPLLLLVLLFMGWGFLRLLPDLGSNAMLALRNACFVWYLSVSCLVFVLPLRASVLENCFKAIFVLAWASLLCSDVRGLFVAWFSPDWPTYVGVMVPFGFGLLVRSWWLAALAFWPIAFGMGQGYWMGFQRLTVLCLAATVVVIPLLGSLWGSSWALTAWRRRGRWPRYAGRLLLFLALFASSAAYLGRKPLLVSLGYSSNPFKKATSDSKGVEVFRKQLWLDAWNLFEERPLVGIGFKRQVVYRYITDDPRAPWVPNDRAPHEDDGATAPLAGPHNSYLNAIARMGVAGILILVIHVVAAFALWRRRLPMSFLIVVALILYAFLNVGLEGPQRSMFGLLALGLAMKERTS